MCTRNVLVATLAGALAAVACSPKTDEERLRAAVDTTSVHLYVAAKAALGSADDRPGRVEVLSALGAVRSAQNGPDFGALVRTLWEMRAEGKRIVASGEDTPPVLPRLVGSSGALASSVDAKTEHAVLLLGFVAMRLQPAPAPVPDAVLLYEAWKTDPVTIPWDGMRGALHATRAIVFGGHDLCTLSSREAASADDRAGDGVALARSTKTLLQVDLAPATASASLALVTALAHGMAGVCHASRSEPSRAGQELTLFCDGAEKAGIRGSDLVDLRAYAELSAGRGARASELLMAAAARATDPAERARLEALAAKAKSDAKAALSELTPSHLASRALSAVSQRIDALGVLTPLAHTPVGSWVSALGSTAGEVVAKGRELLPSWEEVKGAGARAVWGNAPR
jgi:hypothetical protein